MHVSNLQTPRSRKRDIAEIDAITSHAVRRSSDDAFGGGEFDECSLLASLPGMVRRNVAFGRTDFEFNPFRKRDVGRQVRPARSIM